jgi:hypothetical protein
MALVLLGRIPFLGRTPSLTHGLLGVFLSSYPNPLSRARRFFPDREKILDSPFTGGV